MLVAVIDDGIYSEHLSIGPLKYDVCVTARGRVRKRKPNEKNNTFHGAIAAGIIRKYSPEAEFCSVCIFSGGILETTCIKLVAALKWCLKMKIPIINLSLGTIDQDDFEYVQRITDKLIKNGQIIIAACNNNGMYTVPAMLPGVIGVKTDDKLIDNEYVLADNLEGVDFIASSNHELTFVNGYTFRTPISNSYAAPTITAAVINGKIKF